MAPFVGFASQLGIFLLSGLLSSGQLIISLGMWREGGKLSDKIGVSAVDMCLA